MIVAGALAELVRSAGKERWIQVVRAIANGWHVCVFYDIQSDEIKKHLGYDPSTDRYEISGYRIL